MAAKGKTKEIKSRTVLAVVIFILLLGIVISIFDSVAPEKISWKRIFSVVGLDGVADVDAPMQIHVMDVGNADCILVCCDGKTILIDSGYCDSASQIINYLKHLDIDTINLAVVTHADADHIGSMAKVISEVHTDRLMLSEPMQSEKEYTPLYHNLLNSAGELNVEIVYAAQEDAVTLGELYIYALNSTSNFQSENDNSLILHMEYGDTSYLFMGDAEEAAERDLCRNYPDLRSDFIKIGHHGSATSTTEMLLDTVQPRYAAISVGEDRNNLPKEEVLRRLANHGVEVYRTDFNGTCVFYSDGHNIYVRTEEEY